MKKHVFLWLIAAVFAAECAALVLFAVYTPDFSQDVIAVNEAVQSLQADWDALDTHVNRTSLDYVVLDTDGKVLYRTRTGLSESIHAAISERDTVLDITVDGTSVGKVLIRNDGAAQLRAYKRTTVLVLSAAVALQAALCIGYVVYVQRAFVYPFRNLKNFAERIAGGDLDIPLKMDKRNLFGAFTESFDIMRSELRRARIAEANANRSKKELVAKLSHDIKTPVASIKAVAEVGQTVSKSEKEKASYGQIIQKADQIDGLIGNLFTATLEELDRLTVTPADMPSAELKDILENADYLHRAAIPEMPPCLLYADKLRLQQVFDNIFSNSYKYADTDIRVTVRADNDAFEVCIEDCGGGVAAEELPALKEKFFRGKNATAAEGAGLGLYISDRFMREMGGSLTAENGEHGLKVTVTVLPSGKF